MATKTILCWVTILLITANSKWQDIRFRSQERSIDYVQAFKDTLMNMAARSENDYFKMHCNSFLSVINGKINSSAVDTAFIMQTYHAFNKQDAASPKMLSTYLNRKRPFIFSWISPTDGNVSFAWMNPPKNWNPENKYPVYIQLHGLWSVAANSTEYLTYPFLQDASDHTSFEDGYLLSPWGRGNYLYQGISETDIFECLDAIQKTVQIDSSRRYLSGHSMGGYGAWSIAGKSPDIWAALGIYAGALWYYPDVLTSTMIQQLKDVPTYFVCGLNDQLLGVNEEAYQLLQGAGNKDMLFVTFSGGHEYTEQNVKNMYLWMKSRIKNSQSTAINDDPLPSELSIRCIKKPGYNNISFLVAGNVHSDAEIKIFDIFGRLIRSFEKIRMQETSIDFETSGMNRGLYIVQLKSGDQSVNTKMILE